MKMNIGIKGVQSVKVTEENTAKTVGSGMLPVFATPAMAALMEKTAALSVAPYLGDGEGTVGISLNIRHLAATPIGLTVTCESELIEIDRKRLVFSLKVSDGVDVIGDGTHERFIINNEKFMSKAESKKG
jgi:predicted thioesterase